MDWITDQIAIGNYLDAQDVELLRRENISSILSLDGSLAGRVAEFGVKKIAVVKLHDGPGNNLDTFFRAVNSLTSLSAHRRQFWFNAMLAGAGPPSSSRVTSSKLEAFNRTKRYVWSPRSVNYK